MRRNVKITLYSLLLVCMPLFAVEASNNNLPISKSPAGAVVYIIEPQDGAIVESKFTVKFGLRGMGVAPAGVDIENTGHHHLLVDFDELPKPGQPLGADVIHFGGGQTETTIELPKGKHTLQLLLGNHLHIPHDPPVASEKITITVK